MPVSCTGHQCLCLGKYADTATSTASIAQLVVVPVTGTAAVIPAAAEARPQGPGLRTNVPLPRVLHIQLCIRPTAGLPLRPAAPPPPQRKGTTSASLRHTRGARRGEPRARPCTHAMSARGCRRTASISPAALLPHSQQCRNVLLLKTTRCGASVRMHAYNGKVAVRHAAPRPLLHVRRRSAAGGPGLHRTLSCHI